MVPIGLFHLLGDQMADQWYIRRAESKQGPFTSQKLRELAQNGQLQRDDLLWREGMAKWQPASAIGGLFSAQQPPPLPPALTNSSRDPRRSRFGAAKIVAILAGGGFFSLILMCGMCGLLGLVTRKDDASKTVESAPSDAAKSKPNSSQPGVHPKLAAFGKVVAKYKQSPDEYATEDMRRQFNSELDELQKAFFAIPFDPRVDRAMAIEIMESFKRRVESQYKGHLYNGLVTHIQVMHQQVVAAPSDAEIEKRKQRLAGVHQVIAKRAVVVLVAEAGEGKAPTLAESRLTLMLEGSNSYMPQKLYKVMPASVNAKFFTRQFDYRNKNIVKEESIVLAIFSGDGSGVARDLRSYLKDNGIKSDWNENDQLGDAVAKQRTPSLLVRLFTLQDGKVQIVLRSEVDGLGLVPAKKGLDVMVDGLVLPLFENETP